MDRVHYSVPGELVRRPLLVKLFWDRLEVVSGDQVVASHSRAFERGDQATSAAPGFPKP